MWQLQDKTFRFPIFFLTNLCQLYNNFLSREMFNRRASGLWLPKFWKLFSATSAGKAVMMCLSHRILTTISNKHRRRALLAGRLVRQLRLSGVAAPRLRRSQDRVLLQLQQEALGL